MTDNSTQQLVDKIKEVRRRKNISQRKLAQLSGVAKETISRIENGSHIPTIETISKLAKALGLKLDLVEDSDE